MFQIKQIDISPSSNPPEKKDLPVIFNSTNACVKIR